MWARLVAGTMYRGQFEERLEKVIEEITNSDTIFSLTKSTCWSAVRAGGSMDAAIYAGPGAR